jgi:hypothetical protein
MSTIVVRSIDKATQKQAAAWFLKHLERIESLSSGRVHLDREIHLQFTVIHHV